MINGTWAPEAEDLHDAVQGPWEPCSGVSEPAVTYLLAVWRRYYAKVQLQGSFTACRWL